MVQSITSDSPILIIGAGIAGLTLAQGLRLRSIPFRVFERHPQTYRLQGHRFRISADGIVALKSVLSPPLQDLLNRTIAEQARLKPRYVDVRKLEYTKPEPEVLETMTVDRTWIRMLAALDIKDSIEYEKEFESYEIVDGRVRVKFSDGSVALGQFLVGADGIKSHVRRQLQPSRRLLDLERWIMWGRTPLTEELKKNIPQDMISWCMYVDKEANVQAIIEPMMWSKSVREESQNRLPDFSSYLYWALCTATAQFSEALPKTAEEKRAYLDAMTKTWHPALKFIFSSAALESTACIPVLSSKPDIEVSSTGQTGKIILIGDAAHAMSPMGGSGGDTAVRNAADLALTIANEGVTRSSIAKFEARMEERSKEKIEHSFRGGQKFWRGKEWSKYHETDLGL